MQVKKVPYQIMLISILPRPVLCGKSQFLLCRVISTSLRSCSLACSHQNCIALIPHMTEYVALFTAHIVSDAGCLGW